MTSIPFRREIAQSIARFFCDQPPRVTGWGQLMQNLNDRESVTGEVFLEFLASLKPTFTRAEIEVAVTKLMNDGCLSKRAGCRINIIDGEPIKRDVTNVFPDRSLWAYLEPATPPEQTRHDTAGIEHAKNRSLSEGPRDTSESVGWRMVPRRTRLRKFIEVHRETVLDGVECGAVRPRHS